MRYLIDAGHGIETLEKESPDGRFKEYLWNRQVADLVFAELQERGRDVAMIVTETNDIPLKTRAMRVNNHCKELGSQNCLLISIHSNKYGEGWTSPNYWTCYTSRGETISDKIAECFVEAFQFAFPDQRIEAPMEADFYVLKKTQCPAILLENWFYSNKSAVKWLMLDETKMKIALAIVDALERWRKRQ